MVGNITPASFKSLMRKLIIAVPPQILYYFWFTILIGKGSSGDLNLAFLFLTTGQGTYVGILPSAKYVHTNYAFWN